MSKKVVVMSTPTPEKRDAPIDDIDFSSLNIEEEVTDPFCVADKPQITTFQDITAAAFRIKSGIEMTACPVSSWRIKCSALQTTVKLF
jgi:threonine dehydratase